MSKIVSLSEWKRVRDRVDRMTLPELAMSVHQLIDAVIDLKAELDEVKSK